jgi:hypothetical protein
MTQKNNRDDCVPKKSFNRKQKNTSIEIRKFAIPEEKAIVALCLSKDVDKLLKARQQLNSDRPEKKNKIPIVWVSSVVPLHHVFIYNTFPNIFFIDCDATA